jgi:NitT/TauT family transport system ATP-binding protein
MLAGQEVLSLSKISKAFNRADGEQLRVLDGIDLRIRAGEIVALLGKSGSGKSTLLRIMAGLSRPTGGNISYRGHPIDGPLRGVAMVFQNFALFPWLTVLQNVELGLEALGVPRAERRTRALKAIDIIGLDGFESAFPKELSGGMRQRVGFARALVVNPEILLMDEPFSALDVLTAETLRTELLELWEERRIPTQAIVLVSHNIEEAVLMADRILIFGNNPGRIRTEIPVALKRPRDRQSPAFRYLVEDIYEILTNEAATPKAGAKRELPTLGYRLPEASTGQLAGLMEAILEAPHGGHADVAQLAQGMSFPVDDLFQLLEALQSLGFARLGQGEIELTTAGRAYANGDIQQRKQLFAQHLVQHIPLAAHIRRVLEERRGHRAPKERFQRELEDYLSEDEAERVLTVLIDWGRYAEIFAYDHNAGILSLENEGETAPVDAYST